MLQTLVYNKVKGIQQLDTSDTVARLLKNQKNLLWLDITNPSETEIDLMVDVLRFHQLAIEDSIFPQNQPKIEDYSDYLHIVVHEMNYPLSHEHLVETRELNLFIGANYIVTIHSEPLASLTKLFKRSLNKPAALQQGSGFLLHAIIDNVVDGYFPVVDQIEERIEKIEDDVLYGPARSLLERIVEMRKSIVTLRNFIVPQRKILGMLCRSNMPFIRHATTAYFRDVYDHVVRVGDMLDTYRDVLNSTMDAYMSVVSQRTGEVMKTLTIITTIIMPLTLITSFYGMNVAIPEFKWGFWGYLVVIGLLLCSVTGMLIILKRKKWI